MNQPSVTTGKAFKGLKKPAELRKDLDHSVWVDCEFVDCEFSGIGLFGSVFSRCSFKEVIFYWASAFQVRFIDCKFIDCDMRGWFDESAFVRCGFENCEVGNDNLGGEVKWENSIAHECVVCGDPLPIA